MNRRCGIFGHNWWFERLDCWACEPLVAWHCRRCGLIGPSVIRQKPDRWPR